MNRASPRSRQLPLPTAKMDQFSLDGDEDEEGQEQHQNASLALLQVRPLQSIQPVSQGGL